MPAIKTVPWLTYLNSSLQATVSWNTIMQLLRTKSSKKKTPRHAKWAIWLKLVLRWWLDIVTCAVKHILNVTSWHALMLKFFNVCVNICEYSSVLESKSTAWKLFGFFKCCRTVSVCKFRYHTQGHCGKPTLQQLLELLACSGPAISFVFLCYLFCSHASPASLQLM